jgi:hypothetical protein
MRIGQSIEELVPVFRIAYAKVQVGILGTVPT